MKSALILETLKHFRRLSLFTCVHRLPLGEACDTPCFDQRSISFHSFNLVIRATPGLALRLTTIVIQVLGQARNSHVKSLLRLLEPFHGRFLGPSECPLNCDDNNAAKCAACILQLGATLSTGCRNELGGEHMGHRYPGKRQWSRRRDDRSGFSTQSLGACTEASGRWMHCPMVSTKLSASWTKC